jgi:hypothetical protein
MICSHVCYTSCGMKFCQTSAEEYALGIVTSLLESTNNVICYNTILFADRADYSRV